MSERESGIVDNPWGFACQWYNEEDIERSIQRQLSRRYVSGTPIPRDVASPEFARWLTHQYRLAMRKGAELAVSGMNCGDSPSPQPITAEALRAEGWEEDAFIGSRRWSLDVTAELWLVIYQAEESWMVYVDCTHNNADSIPLRPVTDLHDLRNLVAALRGGVE